jgi:hypothetical protein
MRTRSLVGKVADEAAEREGKLFHEERHGGDLLVPRELGVLPEVDDLEVVAALEVLAAQRPDRRDRVHGPGRGPRDVESQHVTVLLRGRRRGLHASRFPGFR